ncbi:hypothetical protein Trco_004711 [Trichoderma cornu-damae]|uniref:Uncharacterized protein n=1 Tax=Trichoderma cornu-damae TaxID=654480 RepID=A0A9P8TUP5_9HYPO|nr:hypothetical protein Trco_004711 [Trichoderma cornu-damae]
MTAPTTLRFLIAPENNPGAAWFSGTSHQSRLSKSSLESPASQFRLDQSRWQHPPQPRLQKCSLIQE